MNRENSTVSQLFEKVSDYKKPYMPMKVDLKGRVAILTGVTGMIGGAVASLYASCGAHVAAWGRKDDIGNARVREIIEQGGDARYYHVELSDTEAVKAAVEKVASDYGRIDILFANAGANFTNKKPVIEMDEALFDRNIDVNIMGGTIWLARFVLPYMVKQGGGSIIFTSSVCGVTGLRNQCGFVASKFAVNALARSLALEYGKHNIRVNALAPGSVPSPDERPNFLWDSCSFDNFEENFMNPATMLYDIAARRPGHPTDMAGITAYLASDDARYTTGQVISVDGGWTAGLSGDY